MDQQIRELLASEIGDHVGWYMREQTKHLVEAMPCTCKDSEKVFQNLVRSTHIKCNRCKKLEELK